ncbi:MAG TPA: AHH domain-containing protein [Tissierellales bacterium]|nr:AHH domain-containing protein [Tissierellales bacterium]
MDTTLRITASDVRGVEVTAEGSKNTKFVSKPNQMHHFATNKSSKYTNQFENITNRYGLDLDDVWNKELMPHQGRHPYAYHDYVPDNMKKFDKVANGDVNKFLALFDQMKQKIINNPEMLYKDYWLKK